MKSVRLRVGPRPPAIQLERLFLAGVAAQLAWLSSWRWRAPQDPGLGLSQPKRSSKSLSAIGPEGQIHHFFAAEGGGGYEHLREDSRSLFILVLDGQHLDDVLALDRLAAGELFDRHRDGDCAVCQARRETQKTLAFVDHLVARIQLGLAELALGDARLLVGR